ncbi:MAG: Elongation factor Ts [Parcubacteria group bacterium ADurb.Bin326]|nr:MAG: Elongation factor Ts [Parcubacteria group bacterium ADurb.Bin326]
MSIDVKLISQLRDKTGAGLGDCKAALEEVGGDLDKALEVMRKKGEVKAAKKADRATKEGIVAIAKSGNKTAVVALACETDFVSRGEAFQSAVNAMADKLLNSSEEEFKVWADEQIKDLVLKIGENIQLSNYGVFDGAVVGQYIHSNKKVAGITVLNGGDQAVADDIAMQIAAMSPRWLKPEEVDADVLAKEKEIYREQLLSEGKPEAMIEKITEGKLAKFYEENCLLNQVFIKDDSKKIKDLLAGAEIVSWAKFQV